METVKASTVDSADVTYDWPTSLLLGIILTSTAGSDFEDVNCMAHAGLELVSRGKPATFEPAGHTCLLLTDSGFLWTQAVRGSNHIRARAVVSSIELRCERSDFSGVPSCI